MKKRIFLAMLLVFMGFASALNAQEASKKSVKELLYLLNVDKMSEMMLKQMFTSFTRMDSKVPKEFWQDAMKEFDTHELVDKIVPVYQKYLSEEDIQKAISFYKSEAGNKFIKHQSQMYQEGAIIGREWGREIGTKVLAKYKAKYQKTK